MISRLTFILTITGLVALLQSATSAQSLSIDDFNAYSNGTVLATNSTPSTYNYKLNGTVGSAFTSTTSSPLDPPSSAVLPLANLSGTQYERFTKVFSSAQNLSSYTQATVLSQSLSASTTTLLYLYLTDAAGTIYLSTTAMSEVGSGSSPKTFTFAFSAMTRQAGNESLANFLPNVTGIGIQATTASGTDSETVEFDDFAISSSPEPGSVALMSCGAMGLLLKRRRGSRYAV